MFVGNLLYKICGYYVCLISSDFYRFLDNNYNLYSEHDLVKNNIIVSDFILNDYEGGYILLKIDNITECGLINNNNKIFFNKEKKCFEIKLKKK
jgi:hypothetical protein